MAGPVIAKALVARMVYVEELWHAGKYRTKRNTFARYFLILAISNTD